MARVEAVVQSRVDNADPWGDEGVMRAPTPEAFDKAARKYLRLYRLNHPHMKSQLVKRTTIVLDEVLEG